MLDGMQIDSKDRHGAVDTYDIDPRTLLTSDRARRSAANRLLEVYGYSNEIGEADLHDFLAAVLFGPGIKITGNRPINAQDCPWRARPGFDRQASRTHRGRMRLLR